MPAPGPGSFLAAQLKAVLCVCDQMALDGTEMGSLVTEKLQLLVRHHSQAASPIAVAV